MFWGISRSIGAKEGKNIIIRRKTKGKKKKKLTSIIIIVFPDIISVLKKNANNDQ